MIQKEYINSFQKNYIRSKIHKENEIKPRYQYQILAGRKLEGMLSASMHMHNGVHYLYYDISAKQSLSKWFIKEKINAAWMEKFANSLRTALWSMEQYLLDERNLILHPDCIFQDMEEENIFFLYYPYYAEEGKADMEEFLTFLVENADEGEPETIDALYAIFSKWEAMGEAFTAEQILYAWDKRKGESLKPVEQDVPAMEISLQEDIAGEEVSLKKNLTEFLFGRHKFKKPENVAMESWEYCAEKPPEENERMERTTYMEVPPEQEERKLYGNGKQNRKVISLDHLPLIIGKKSEKTDMVLADVSISRMHARLSEEEGKIYLEDLNATNGTFKNGVRLKPYEKVMLLKEDEIKLGKLSFTYR